VAKSQKKWKPAFYGKHNTGMVDPPTPQNPFPMLLVKLRLWVLMLNMVQ